MKQYKPYKEGKVRELYDLEDSLVMVCTDRISAFDKILETDIPEKGDVLNYMSKFWFDLTKDIIPNHMLSVDTKDMPEFFQTDWFAKRSMKTLKLDMIPVECIVRGYITGSGWESYKMDGHVCGISLPEGLKECQKLPEALFTPSTKAPVGEHDMNISMEEGAVWLDKFFPGKGKEYMEKLPKTILKIIIESREENYNPKYDLSIPLKNQDINRKSIAMITLLHYNYWCETQEEKSNLPVQLLFQH